MFCLVIDDGCVFNVVGWLFGNVGVFCFVVFCGNIGGVICVFGVVLGDLLFILVVGVIVIVWVGSVVYFVMLLVVLN